MRKFLKVTALLVTESSLQKVNVELQIIYEPTPTGVKVRDTVITAFSPDALSLFEELALENENEQKG